MTDGGGQLGGLGRTAIQAALEVAGLRKSYETDRDVPVRRDVFGRWLLVAEAKAELPKLNGSLWHAYRRGWATARKDLSLTDVAAAGGWSDPATLLKCYQDADNETMEMVMSHPRKVASA